MPDIKDIGSFGGAISIVAVLCKLLWEGSDRSEAKNAKKIRAVVFSEESSMPFAAMIRSDTHVKQAVVDVAVVGAEDSGKFVDAGMQRLVNEQLRKDLSDVKSIVRSSDKKLNALITAARIKVRAVDLGAFEEEES